MLYADCRIRNCSADALGCDSPHPSLVHLLHPGTNCAICSQWIHNGFTISQRDLNSLSLFQDWETSSNSTPRNSSAFLSGCRSRDFVRKASRKERACLGSKIVQGLQAPKCTLFAVVTGALRLKTVSIPAAARHSDLFSCNRLDLDDFRMRGCDLVA